VITGVGVVTDVEKGVVTGVATGVATGVLTGVVTGLACGGAAAGIGIGVATTVVPLPCQLSYLPMPYSFLLLSSIIISLL